MKRYLTNISVDGDVAVSGGLTAPIITNHDERISALEKSGGSGGSGYDPRVGNIGNFVDIEGFKRADVTEHLSSLTDYFKRFLQTYDANWYNTLNDAVCNALCISDLYFSFPTVSVSAGGSAIIAVTIRSYNRAYESIQAFISNVRIKQDGNRFSVLNSTKMVDSKTTEEYCVMNIRLTGAQLGDKFYLYDATRSYVRSNVIFPVIIGGPTSAPSLGVYVAIEGTQVSIIGRISDYNPSGLTISWKINGAVTTDAVFTSSEQTMPNGKHFTTSVLKRTKTQFSTYTSISCQITHQGKTVEKRITPSDWL